MQAPAGENATSERKGSGTGQRPMGVAGLGALH